jgi:hypothetical protein
VGQETGYSSRLGEGEDLISIDDPTVHRDKETLLFFDAEQGNCSAIYEGIAAFALNSIK